MYRVPRLFPTGRILRSGIRKNSDGLGCSQVFRRPLRKKLPQIAIEIVHRVARNEATSDVEQSTI